MLMVRDISEGTFKTLAINRNTLTNVKSLDLDNSYLGDSVVQIALAHASGDGLEASDEDAVMSDALEAGASDFQADEDVFEIYTEPSDFSGVRDDLEAKGYSFVSAEVEMVPDTYTDLTDPDQILKMQKLIDALEDNDDVQQVWHNWNEPEEEDED